MSLSDERSGGGKCSSLEESSHGGKKSAIAGESESLEECP
jgi:hypothetical protein